VSPEPTTTGVRPELVRHVIKTFYNILWNSLESSAMSLEEHAQVWKAHFLVTFVMYAVVSLNEIYPVINFSSSSKHDNCVIQMQLSSKLDLVVLPGPQSGGEQAIVYIYNGIGAPDNQVPRFTNQCFILYGRNWKIYNSSVFKFVCSPR
jgi:hypothetical protein